MLLAFGAVTLRAQPGVEIIRHERVRISAPSFGMGQSFAFFEGLNGDSVDLRFDDGLRRLPVSRVSFEVKRPDRAFSAFMMSGIGLVVGGLYGRALYDVTEPQWCFFVCPPPKSRETIARERLQSTVRGAAVGLAGGLVVGITAPWSFWVPAVPSSRISAGLMAPRDQVGLRIWANF